MNRTGALLAFLAVFLNVLIPQGTMAARQGDAVAIVICTGHGPLIARGRDTPDKKGAAHHDGVCAFAGHGLADAPPMSAVNAVAAPPPPSRGPPQLI